MHHQTQKLCLGDSRSSTSQGSRGRRSSSDSQWSAEEAQDDRDTHLLQSEALLAFCGQPFLAETTSSSLVLLSLGLVSYLLGHQIFFLLSLTQPGFAALNEHVTHCLLM